MNVLSSISHQAGPGTDRRAGKLISENHSKYEDYECAYQTYVLKYNLHLSLRSELSEVTIHPEID